MINNNKKKGFTLLELVAVIAIMAVLLAVLAPSLMRYVERSRKQRDETTLDEVCHAVKLAMSDSGTFDEVYGYTIPNNFITYTDSSGIYGQQIKDEEFWAPDGSGRAVTITFNPDENGEYTVGRAIVNDMTYGNGSVACQRTCDSVDQCCLYEMGRAQLYNKIQQAMGTVLETESATYRRSSFTIFIVIEMVNGVPRENVYGQWNGTNLTDDSPASKGSGTSSYNSNNQAITTTGGGTTKADYTSSDLKCSGVVLGTPSYKQPSSSQPSKPTKVEYVKIEKVEVETVDPYFAGRDVWSDGTNTYYSYGSYQLMYNGKDWVEVDWNGLSVGGEDIWTDGENVYYSDSSRGNVHKVLKDGQWVTKTWSGNTRFDGAYIWQANGKTYYSLQGTQYVLDGSTWKKQTWSGDLTKPIGSCVWSDGKNTYYSDGTSQYVLNGDKWEKKIWGGLQDFIGEAVWTDGTHVYYSMGTQQYVYINGDWSKKTWDGISSFNGMDVWSDGTNYYYTSNGKTYQFS